MHGIPRIIKINDDFKIVLPNGSIGLPIPSSNGFLDLPVESLLKGSLNVANITEVTALNEPKSLILKFIKKVEDKNEVLSGEISYRFNNNKLVLDYVIFYKKENDGFKKIGFVKCKPDNENETIVESVLDIQVENNSDNTDNKIKYNIYFKTPDSQDYIQYVKDALFDVKNENVDLIRLSVNYSVQIKDSQLKEAIRRIEESSCENFEIILRSLQNLFSSPNLVVPNQIKPKMLPFQLSDSAKNSGEINFLNWYIGRMIICPSKDGVYAIKDTGTNITYTITVRNRTVIDYTVIEDPVTKVENEGPISEAFFTGFVKPAPGYKDGEDLGKSILTKNRVPVSLIIDTVSKKENINGKDARFASEFAKLLNEKLGAVTITDLNTARTELSKIFLEIEKELIIEGFPPNATMYMVFSIAIKLNSETIVYSNGDTKVIGISKENRKIVFENIPANKAYDVLVTDMDDYIVKEVDAELVHKFIEILKDEISINLTAVNGNKFIQFINQNKVKYPNIAKNVKAFLNKISSNINRQNENSIGLKDWVVRLSRNAGITKYSRQEDNHIVSIPFSDNKLKSYPKCDIVLNMSDGVSDVIPPKTLNNILSLFQYNIHHVNFIISKLITYIHGGQLSLRNPNHFRQYLIKYFNNNPDISQYLDQEDSKIFEDKILDILKTNFTRMFDILNSCKEKNDDSSIIIMQTQQ